MLLVEQTQVVLARLPAAALTRSQLAAQLLGDAHGLDPGNPVATLVLAVLRHARAREDDGEAEETVRELWAAAGVLVNELARPVLFLICVTVPANMRQAASRLICRCAH